VVSVGLPLQRVYCACVGEASLSLAGGEHECAAHAPQISEHDHHGSACCKVTTECQMTDAEDHDCGFTDVIVAQFDADYLADASADLFIGQPMITAAAWPAYRPLAALAVVKTRPIRGPAPPDRPAGRQLLVAQQIFLI